MNDHATRIYIHDGRDYLYSGGLWWRHADTRWLVTDESCVPEVVLLAHRLELASQ